ncbi:MAG: OmpA family protein [Cyclobacteriaceae bacterium]
MKAIHQLITKHFNTYKYSQLKSLLILGSVAVAFTMTSCVSQKKYTSALEEIAKLSVDSIFQEYELSNTKFRKDGVIYAQKSELLAKSQKLDSLEALINMQIEKESQRKESINRFQNSDWKVEEKERELLIELKEDIFFEVSSNKLSENGQEAIESIVTSLLNLNDDFELLVVGHTDNQTYDSEEKDNWDLSSERALVVVRELVKNGINPSKITASAKSKYDPETSNDSRKLLNRRTEIIIVPESTPYQIVKDLLQQK